MLRRPSAVVMMSLQVATKLAGTRPGRYVLLSLCPAWPVVVSGTKVARRVGMGLVMEAPVQAACAVVVQVRWHSGMDALELGS
jgi:hypothetical protein